MTDYESVITDPVERIKVELKAKNLIGTCLVTIIGVTGLHLVLPMAFYTNTMLAIVQICSAFGIVYLYYKKPQHLGPILCILFMIVDALCTFSDEKIMLCGLGFSIVFPGFMAFLTQSKRMASVGLIYSILLNIAVGPLFYEMILRESENQNLADLLDSSRIALNVFTFYDFAFTALEDSRFNKILNTLAVTLKAEEQMKQEKELLNSKSLFFSCFSHELRNPLNCILGSMDFAIKYATDNVICDMLSTGKACGSLLVNLINNILDMGKLDSNNICLNEDMRDSKQFITNIWRVTQELFKKKKQVGEFSVDRHFPAMIHIDDMRLTQVMVNLISNACKFTGEGKTVRIVFSFESSEKPDLFIGAHNAIGLSLEHPQLNNNSLANGALFPGRGHEMRTVQSPAPPPVQGYNSSNSCISLNDDRIEESHLERLTDIRKRKTLHHVKTNSETPIIQNRYVLVFSTCGTSQELTEWNFLNVGLSPLLNSQKGEIKIEVMDSGCGMTEGEVGRLFKPFVQANKTITSTYGGTGLGLYITQSLIHLMRGTITVKSGVNVGSTFTVLIPNDSTPSTDIITLNKRIKSQSPFKRFKVILFTIKPETNTSRSPDSSFAERMRNLSYRMEQVNHFMSPQTHLDAPSNFLKTYVVYDASYLTTENIQELKKTDLKGHKNSVFFFNSNLKNAQGQLISALQSEILVFSDLEMLADEIHNQTKALLVKIKSSHSILIVDDDDFNRKIFSVFLAKEGYNIYTAQNGQQGYQVFCKHAADIKMVVVDYEMPICDGPTCAEMILEHIKKEGLPKVPIYGLTGNVSQESRERIAKAGIRKAWTKPAKLEEIMDEIFYSVVK